MTVPPTGTPPATPARAADTAPAALTDTASAALTDTASADGSVAAAGQGAPQPWLRGSAPLTGVHDVLLLDLDGVVYVGPHPVAHAADRIAAARRGGLRVAFVTNNASRAPADVAAQLRDLGVSAQAADVVTSAQAGAAVVAGLVTSGGAVLVVGAPALQDAVTDRGLRPVATAAHRPAAVIQGFGPDVGWRLLAEGAYALADPGVVWVATNTDLTIPTPGGIAPGNGSLVAVLATVTGRTPVVAGKPEPALLIEAVNRTAAAQPLVVGDRLDTDILGAVRAGLPSLLVLTGVTTVPALLAAGPQQRPTYLAADLRGLDAAQPAATVLTDDRSVCGTASAAMAGDRVEVTVADGGGDGLDGLRAVAALTWARTDLGLPTDVTGLNVAALVPPNESGTAAER